MWGPDLEKELLQSRADACNRSLSEWARHRLLEAARFSSNTLRVLQTRVYNARVRAQQGNRRSTDRSVKQCSGSQQCLVTRPRSSTHRPQEGRMSDLHSLLSVTEPERDMLVWYRLGPEPIQYPLRQVATISMARSTPAQKPRGSARTTSSTVAIRGRR